MKKKSRNIKTLINEQTYRLFVIMHNKISLLVTLNEGKGLFKIPRYTRNDSVFVHFSDLLIYRKYNVNRV